MSGPSAVISAEQGRRWSDAEALTAVHCLQGKVLMAFLLFFSFQKSPRRAVVVPNHCRAGGHPSL